ncbi:hypothetical protein [Caballeronia grimmiae]|uniref:hypothetical protein n=1 Tax=Caballeronia grimmiae TaxID=1071679 RepID=UPI0038BA9301
MRRLLALLGDEARPGGEDRYAADGLVIEACSMTLMQGIAFARDRHLSLLRTPDNVNYRDGVSRVEFENSPLHFRGGHRGAQGFAPNDCEPDDDARYGSNDASRDASEASDRWPAEAPSAAVAQVVLAVDDAITLKRRAAAAWVTAHGDAVPLLPVKPSRLELAVIMALAETYGAALSSALRFVPVIDFIADYGAVKLVQRVMYGARPITDFDVTAFAAENARLAELLRAARTAFEFLCATWPEAFMAVDGIKSVTSSSIKVSLRVREVAVARNT